MSNRAFYQDLPVRTNKMSKLLGKEKLFAPVPPDWQVIVIDVMGSTQAVAAGRHHDVNLAATGGIITVLNRLRTKYDGLVIPYFFGGDGATFIVPAELSEDLVAILDNYRHHVKQRMDLVLRVGALGVDKVYAGGTSIRISRAALNRLYIIPVVLGNGLKEAETKIKATFIDEEALAAKLEALDLTGMECRWNEIAPPRDAEQILVLLVSSQEDTLQGRIYGEVISRIDRIFGPLNQRLPIGSSRLVLNLGLMNLAKEMYASLGRLSFRYLLRNWIATLYGPWYFKRTEAGKKYLARITQLTDSLMLDGNINTVISGTDAQIKELITDLEKLEQAGKIVFGYHVTHASVMSCYVRDHDEDHVHFLDGTEGGYTSAARMFKQKLRERKQE
ncbi:DUF3095 domain-containing protein [Neolewinella aurantiaca]|uniref:DUF3095 domain-containing protein n=1 Tax=Neolewinella aurantiaca TaxID=2602767 RepID=A0A5C7FPJ7_9BACT|nr:DUF3095 family protein [Neolewinella aurantiaca]TXF86665.1 DUF3095 domain-containing protein [Neolewinella aurantiaca]